jgi:hypothetical protein
MSGDIDRSNTLAKITRQNDSSGTVGSTKRFPLRDVALGTGSL